MLKFIFIALVPVAVAVFAVNYIFKKIQGALNLPISVPIGHKLIKSRQIVKIENPTLFKVSEKRGFSLLKIVPFLRHNIGSTREYYIAPAYIVPFDKTSVKFKRKMEKSDYFKVLLDEDYRIISKCVGVETRVVGNEKKQVELHNIYIMKKGGSKYGLSDFSIECIKKHLYEVKKPEKMLSGGQMYWREFAKVNNIK